MTTETILTNYQIHSTLHDSFLPFSTQTEGFARAIEQAVLQSSEIQALREDAERMRAALKRISAMDSMSYHTLDSAKITAKAALDQRK